MNPYINMFNVQYIQQQAQLQHHQSQIYEVQKCAKALHDFLEGIDKIEPSYQSMASAEFSMIVLQFFQKHGVI